MEKLRDNNTIAFKELGFDKEDKTEITKALNEALCSYQIFFHKLQKFHWNVKGGDFFDIHEITEELYTKGLENIDEIAERIRVFGDYPKSNLSQYLANSIISESSEKESPEEMIHIVLGDLEKMMECFLNIHGAAVSSGDIGTSYMISKMMKDFETDHWKLKSFAYKS